MFKVIPPFKVIPIYGTYVEVYGQTHFPSKIESGPSVMIKVHGIEMFVFHACKCFPKCINLLYLATMLESIVLYLFCSQKMCILCLDTCYLNAWLFNQVLLLDVRAVFKWPPYNIKSKTPKYK